MLEFRDTNKDIFKVEEPVTLKVKVKNVPELVIKVFEFNTETYYKQTLKPFDTSINLHGLEPSYCEVVTDMRDTPRNRMQNREFNFDWLANRIGLFIIELQGNGKTSRCVIKKG